MATILRGKRKGEEVRLIQWSNDWFMVEPSDIVSPTSLNLTPEEVERVRNCQYNGHLLSWYTLSDDGTFKKAARIR